MIRRPPEWEQKVKDFAYSVKLICWHFNGSEVSGSRSEIRNARVSGHPRSRHLLGLAADVVFDTREGCAAAWEYGKTLGLHGYIKSGGRSIHWQDRAAAPPPGSVPT